MNVMNLPAAVHRCAPIHQEVSTVRVSQDLLTMKLQTFVLKVFALYIYSMFARPIKQSYNQSL